MHQRQRNHRVAQAGEYPRIRTHRNPTQGVLDILGRLSRVAASNHWNDQFLSEAASAALEALDCEISLIRAITQDENSFVIQAAAGPPSLAVSGLLGTYTPLTDRFRSVNPDDRMTINLQRDSVEPILTGNEGWAFQQLGIRELLLLPLFAGGELVGRIDFARTQERPFSDEDVVTGKLIASIVASTVTIRKLREQADQSQIYRTVIGLHQQIEQLADPPTILQAVVELTLREPGCKRCYAMLWDSEREEFVPTAVAGLEPQLVEMLKLITLSPQVVPAFDRMLHSSRPLLVENAWESTLLPRSLVRALNIQSAMIVPLRGNHHQTIGFLLLDGGDGDEPFSNQAVSVMEGIARHLSTMIENAMLYEEAVSSSDSLAVINEIGIQLAMLTDEERLFRQLHHQIATVIDATNFALGLLSDDRQQIVLRVAVDGQYRQTEMQFVPGRDSISRAIQSGRGSLHGTRDTAEPDQWLADIDELEPSHSQMTVPITVGRNVVGAMSVQSPFRHAYGPKDLSLMSAIALHAGVALENARLYRMVQERGNRRAVVLDRVMQKQEDERKQLVEDIHDNTLQTLAACLFAIDRAQQHAESPDRPGALAEELETVRDQLARNIDHLRKRIFQLRPATLDMLGLEPALREFLASIEKDYGLRINLEVQLPERPDHDTETVLYRLIQEAVSLVQVSGRAASVSVRVRGGDETITVTIHETPPPIVDGDEQAQPADRRGDVGMLALIERAELAGGEVRFARTVGGGSSMQITLPRTARRSVEHQSEEIPAAVDERGDRT